MTTIPTIRDDEFVIDAAAIALVSVAIMTLSRHIVVMTLLVSAVLAARGH